MYYELNRGILEIIKHNFYYSLERGQIKLHATFKKPESAHVKEIVQF